jgi:hypothetical protein
MFSNATGTLVRTASLGVSAMLAGCSGSAGAPKARVVSLAEFAAGSSTLAGEAEAPPTVLVESAANQGDDAPTDLRVAGVPSVADQPFSAPDAQLVDAGDRMFVNSLVGQINGRPIFADEFFAPIDDQLRAEREQMNPVGFHARMELIINQWLTLLVDNELFIAEAEASLTPEQKQGVFAWMRSVQEGLISERGGSRARAERELEEDLGMSLSAVLERRRNAALIYELRKKKIEPRVNISWRDIEREYERSYDKFNPPAQVTLARIRLSTANQAAQIDDVKARLERGDAFSEIATSLGLTDGGVMDPYDSPSGRADDIEINEAFKPHLAGLSTGQTSAAFEHDAFTYWLHVVSIDQPQQYGLFEPIVQRSLKERLEAQRQQKELERYAAHLRERWVADDLEAMRRRLLVIAAERYLR